MNSATIPMEQWASADNYTVRVHALKDAVVRDTGILIPQRVRNIRILVEYANHPTRSSGQGIYRTLGSTFNYGHNDG